MDKALLECVKAQQFNGITMDSRLVKPGYLFVAAKGATKNSADGHDFIDAALKNGATAILCEKALQLKVPTYLAENARKQAAQLFELFYKSPSRRLKVYGVTGTNGKSTVCHLAAQLVPNSATIGTLGWGRIESLKPISHTTPESEELSRMLNEFANEGIKVVFMEVSSHALATHRVDGICFEGTLLTNLSQDHLDFHNDLSDYYNTKKKLFEKPASIHFLPKNCPWLQVVDGKVTTWESTALELSSSLLLGSFNQDNLRCAAALAHHAGETLESIQKKIPKLTLPEGRLQLVSSAVPRVVVDFAHTPDALASALKALRPTTQGKLWVVFGCGGNRDTSKRAQMGTAAEALADRVIITDDNPRHENPHDIHKAILKGSPHASVIADRRLAIIHAIEHAQENDTVLIAGKGHEKTQIRENSTLPFDDVKIAKEALA